MKPLLIVLASLFVLTHTVARQGPPPQQPPPPTLNNGIEEDHNVLVLRNSNIDKAFRTFSHLLVVFHAPWCHPCKGFVPEFTKAATVLKEQGSKITLGKVDCTLEKELAEKYEIKSYPTVKFFLNGKIANYTGGRSEYDILNWVAKTTKTPCIPVEHFGQLENVMAVNDAVLIFWGTPDTEGFQTYESASRDTADLPYVFTISREIQARYRISSDVKVSMLRAFEEPVIHLKEEYNAVTLKKFIRENRFPLIMNFNSQHLKRVFGDKNAVLVFVTGNDHQENQQAWTEFVAAAKQLKGKILSATAAIGTEWGHRIIDHLGGSYLKLPVIAILKPLEYRTDKYIMKGTITTDDIIKFYGNFREKRISPALRTAMAPKSQTGPVTVVVGKTFKEIVNDSEKDVFLFIYAPFCRHSQATLPIVDQLAQHVSSIKNLVIAKMDGSANEIEGLRVANVPYILYFPANNKTTPIVFKGFRTLQGFWTWIESHVTVDYDKSLIPEISADSDDEDQPQSGWENADRGPIDIQISATPATPMMPSLGIQEPRHKEGPQGIASPQTITQVSQIEVSEPKADTIAEDAKDAKDEVVVIGTNDDNGARLGGDDL